MSKRLCLFLIITLFLLSGVSYGFSFKGIVDFPRDKLREILVPQISKALGREIQVGSLRGNLYRTVYLYDVRVAKKTTLAEGTFLKAERIELEFSLFRTIVSRGNVLPYIKKVRIVNPEILVERADKMVWLGIDLASTGSAQVASNGPNKASSPLPLDFPKKLEIIVENGHGTYIDHWGWDEKVRIARPFVRPFTGLNLTATLTKTGKLDYAATVSSIENRLKIGGFVDLKKMAFDFQLKTDNLDVATWVSYIIPVKEMRFIDGRGDLDLRMRNRTTPWHKGESQVELGLGVQVHNGALSFPTMFKQPFRDINGLIYLDTYGISFKKLKGSALGTPVVFDGRIQRYENALISMNIRSLETVDLSRGRDLMTTLEPYDLRGSGNIMIDFSGPIEASTIQGTIGIEHGSIWRIPCTRTDFKFTIQQDTFAFIVPETTLASGKAHIDGLVHFTKKNATIQFSGKDLMLAELIPQVPASGSVDLVITANGPLEKLPLHATLHSTDALIQNQEIRQGVASLALVPGKLLIQDAQVSMNGYANNVTGWVNDRSSFLIQFPSQNLLVYAIPSWNGLALEGILGGSISGNTGTAVPGSETGMDQVHFDLTGDLKNSVVLNEAVNSARGHISWNGQQCSFDAIELVKNNSFLKGSGHVDVSGDFQLDCAPDTRCDLSEWTIIQDIQPRLTRGVLAYSGGIKTHQGHYSMLGVIEAQDLHYGDLIIDEITGPLLITRNIFYSDGLRMKFNGDSFTVSGHYALASLLEPGTHPTLDLTIDIRTDSASINALIRTMTLFNNEMLKATVVSTGDIALTANNGIIGRSNPYQAERYWPFLSDLGRTDTVLAAFEPYRNKQARDINDRSSDLSFGPNARLSGRLFYSTFRGPPIIEADMTIENADLSAFACKKLTFTMDTDTTGQIATTARARSGQLLESTFESLDIVTTYQDDRLTFVSTRLDRPDDSIIDFVQGTLPLAPFWDEQKGMLPLDLTVRLPGDQLNVLGIFNRNIASIRNKGNVELHITGTLLTPNISAPVLDLRNAEITFTSGNVIRSPLVIRSADASLKDNMLTIRAMDITWQGPETNDTPNQLAGRGTIALATFSFIKPELLEMDFDITMDDTAVSLRLEQFYEGTLSLKDVGLKGHYAFPLSKEQLALYNDMPELRELGPTLSATLLAADGSFSLGTGGNTTPNYYPLRFDLSIGIGRNLEVVRGEHLLQVRSLGSLQNMGTYYSFSLRERPEQMRLSGSINRPQLQGKVYFDDGTISLFGRTFTLIDKNAQRKYFGANEGQVQDNQADFGTTTGNFMLVAQTTIEIPEQVTVTGAVGAGTTGNPETVIQYKERDYVVIINGPLDDLSAYTFIRYELVNGIPRQEGEPYVLRDPRSGEALRSDRMRELTFDLAPELFKSAYSSSTYGDAYDKNTAWRDLTRTQVNIIARSMLRPIEKNIARRVGLYDIRLKHDFGKDFTTAAGLERQQDIAQETSTTTTTPEKEQVAGLDLVAELLQGRLYLTLNTSLDQGLTRKYWDFRFASYRLTWYLWQQVIFDEISLNYNNRFAEDPDLKEAVSLEAVHAF